VSADNVGATGVEIAAVPPDRVKIAEGSCGNDAAILLETVIGCIVDKRPDNRLPNLRL
jgi:hypothetical protein